MPKLPMMATRRLRKAPMTRVAPTARFKGDGYGPVIACDNNAHPVTDSKREPDDEFKMAAGNQPLPRILPRISLQS